MIDRSLPLSPPSTPVAASTQATELIVAYVPVLHQGYLAFFDRHPMARELFLLGRSYTHQYRSLEKDIRAIDPHLMQRAVIGLDRFDQVEVVGEQGMKKLVQRVEREQLKVVMPDEEVHHALCQRFFSPELSQRLEFDSIFLRWDAKRSRTRRQPQPTASISTTALDQQLMGLAQQHARLSSDWWRHVGAVLVKDGRVVAAARNRHLPQDVQHYTDGDPRADFQSGECIEMSSSIHAEVMVLAQAARAGVATDNTQLYTTTFPCPTCAKLIAQSGVRTVYYQEGYSLLDGETILKSAGIALIQVVEESSAVGSAMVL